MDVNQYIKSYWRYYLLLEQRLARTEEFVAFDKVNGNTYSIEYLALLQAICSEIDAVGKAVTLYFDPTFKTKNMDINKWGFVVQQHLPEIDGLEVRFLKDAILVPWHDWKLEKRVNKKGATYYAFADKCNSPEWWRAYNKVKHARTAITGDGVNYHLANQKNVLMSLSGLFALHRLMIASLDRDAYAAMDRSRLFRLPNRLDEVRSGFMFDSEGRMGVFTDEDE